MELGTPSSSAESFAFFNVRSPINRVPAVDSWSTPQSIMASQPTEISSRNELPSIENNIDEPVGALVFATRPPSPSECSVNSSSLTVESQNNPSNTIRARNEEEEPSRPVRPFTYPKHEREMRRTSLRPRPVSSAGPIQQVLSPPPIKVSFPARRGVGRTPSPPPPRMRSSSSSRSSQLLRESAQGAPELGSPASPTSEGELIQLQVRTQQTASPAPREYVQGFEHVTRPTSRALPTPPVSSVRHIRPLPPLPITAPLTPCIDNLDGADIRSEFDPPAEIIWSPSSEPSGFLLTPPAVVLDITTAWSQQEISPVTSGSWSSARTRGDTCGSTFLSLSPSVLSPLSPESISAMY